MSKFKVGDIAEDNGGCSSYVKGKVVRVSGHKVWLKGAEYEDSWIHASNLKKLGGTMSKYDELKKRIEGLDGNSSLKEADDILTEIQGQYYLLWGYASFLGISTSIIKADVVKRFDWGKNQCEKMDVFRKTLLWLLDHSNIKKTIVGTEQKVEIEGKIYKAKIIKEEND